MFPSLVISGTTVSFSSSTTLDMIEGVTLYWLFRTLSIGSFSSRRNVDVGAMFIVLRRSRTSLLLLLV